MRVFYINISYYYLLLLLLLLFIIFFSNVFVDFYVRCVVFLILDSYPIVGLWLLSNLCWYTYLCFTVHKLIRYIDTQAFDYNIDAQYIAFKLIPYYFYEMFLFLYLLVYAFSHAVAAAVEFCYFLTLMPLDWQLSSDIFASGSWVLILIDESLYARQVTQWYNGWNWLNFHPLQHLFWWSIPKINFFCLFFQQKAFFSYSILDFVLCWHTIYLSNIFLFFVHFFCIITIYKHFIHFHVGVLNGISLSFLYCVFKVIEVIHCNFSSMKYYNPSSLW